MNCVILLAAGSGTRMGNSVEDKILHPIKNVPVIVYSVNAFIRTNKFDHYIIVYRDENQRDQIIKILPSAFKDKYQVRFVKGGDSRQSSVFNALEAIDSTAQYVAIHDAARPLIASKFILKLLSIAEKCQNAVPAHLMKDTIKKVHSSKDGSKMIEAMDRSKLRSVQTPQIFNYDLIHQCYKKVFDSNQSITDDSSALAYSEVQVELFENDTPNPKITTKSDLDYILYLLNQNTH